MQCESLPSKGRPTSLLGIMYQVVAQRVPVAFAIPSVKYEVRAIFPQVVETELHH